MTVGKLISLAELAKLTDVNKSRLNYYAWKGLIKPVHVMGKTMVFDTKTVKKQLKTIEREQIKGKTLKQIMPITSKMKAT